MNEEPVYTICDRCGIEITQDEANQDAFGYAILCNDCYAECAFDEDE